MVQANLRAASQPVAAGSVFNVGRGESLSLNQLIGEGYRVPASSNADFSWGFFKQIKSYVFSTVWNARKTQATHGNGQC